MRDTEVLIVGAGPTGLVLALSLARNGIMVRIIDKKAGVARESRALGVQARTLEFYQQLGIADQVISAGVQVEQIFIRSRGEAVHRLAVGRLGEGLGPYPFILCFAQDEHEELLLRQLRAAGIDVEWETELVAFEQSASGVSATLKSADGQMRQCQSEFLAGCDGARSTVRQHLQIPFEGATAEQSYFVADVSGTGEAVASATAAGSFSFCLSAADFMLVLPVKKSGTFRIIGLIPAVPTTTFDDLRDHVEHVANIKVETVNWFSTYRVHHRVAERFRIGRVFLAGDAGHIHSPLGGQGMNTGIGDAVNLAWKLAAVIQSRADSRILDSYESERIGFARSLVATTDTLFQFVNGAKWRHRFVRAVLFRIMIPQLLRHARTRQVVFRRISQTGIHYRSSVLSEGSAGSVSGGDRLPWIALKDGGDNFAPLKSADWQVHVYGRAQPNLRNSCERIGLAVWEFDWQNSMAVAELKRNACYLVRPDGYLALAEPSGDASLLMKYLDKHLIKSCST